VRNATPPRAGLVLDCGMTAVAEIPAAPEEPVDRLSGTPGDYAIKTWRYLRLAMVGLVVGLVVAVVYEWQAVPSHCVQTSISAYYYTPVRGYFVGALLGIGTCLFCLKGSITGEDLLLNVAGMLAAVVALVPTPDAGTCTSLRGTIDDRAPDIANNVTVLVAVGSFALVVLAILWLAQRPRRRPRAMYVIGAFVWAPAALLFEADRDGFMGSAHDIAAYVMFACILAVVVLNAVTDKAGKRWARYAYAFVAGAMALAAAVIIPLGLLGGWGHWVIGIETAFILLFALFWTIQTVELWTPGLRPNG
jgi:hypothetical protein